MNNNDNDADLRRLFAQIPEPVEDAAFTRRVALKVARERRALKVKRILLAVLAVIVLAVLTPWLTSLIGLFLASSAFLTQAAMLLLLSPAGWALGGIMGLMVFLKARP